MTKKRKTGVNRKNFVAIPFSASVSLSTLADDAIIKIAALGAAFGEDIFVMSADVLAMVRDLTGGETPLEFGVTHSDLSVAEVDEALTAEVTDPDDIIAKERARRPVRRIGLFNGVSTQQQFNDGNPKRVKIKFSIGNGFNLDFWIKNRSGAILTTGAIVEFSGTLFGRWQR